MNKTLSPLFWLFPVALLALSAPTTAQSVGGGYETFFQTDGSTARDHFGRSVSGAGDVNADGFDDIIVGAHWAAPGGLLAAGSVFVYSGADGSLIYQWNGKVDQRFGTSVSGAGDVNADGFDDLIVGALRTKTNTLFQAGAVYVFSGRNGTQLYYWEGASSSDRFGGAVSDAGDTNADGFDDLIVGAAFTYVGGRKSTGSAYVYSGADGTELYQWHGKIENDQFGEAVSGAGDVNGDGFDDLLVGAGRADVGGIRDVGSAFVYSGLDGTTLQHWDGVEYADALGHSVSNAGDVNRDGFEDLIIGAPGAYPNANSFRGLAKVYSGVDGSLLHQFHGGVTTRGYGHAVSGAGDANADGYDDLILGSPYASQGSISWSGTATVFSGVDGVPLKQWFGLATSDEFGYSVSNAGDVNGNGFADIIVGARKDGSGAGGPGSAYVFGFNPFVHSNTNTISASSGGVITLEIDFPQKSGSSYYIVLISASGTGPTLFGTNIPLTYDSLVADTIYGHYPFPTYSGLHGTLDASGNATGGFSLPPGISSSLIGITFHLAVISNRPGLLPEYSSVAIPITITQ